MNLPPQIDWNASDAASINQFLEMPIGKKWLAYLYNRKPRTDLGSTEVAALTGAFAAGYESFFSEIANSRTSVKTEQQYSAKTIDPNRD